MRGKSTHHSVLSLSTLVVAVAMAVSACGGGGGGADEVAVDTPAPTVPPVTGSGSGSTTTPPPANGAGTGTGSGTIVPPAAGTPPVVAGQHVCAALPAMPTKPANVLKVTDFGARGDDGNDDMPAIQAALNAAQPGQWIVFPAGRYIHSKSIKVTKPGVVLWSEGATLHGSNVADQAVWLEADGASVYNFTMTAVTDKRRTTPWESRISIFGGTNPRKLLKNNVTQEQRHPQQPRDQRRRARHQPGQRLRLGRHLRLQRDAVPGGGEHRAALAGRCDPHHRRFVQRPRAEEHGHNGRVLRNTVKEPGDDLIAMVSYIGDPSLPASQVNAEFDTRRARDLVHDVLVANNDVAGNYWGRGITVVGGESITIENNKIAKTYHSAGLYFARELSYLTFGVRDVLARNNAITDVQNIAPSYVPVGFNFRTTGHGGVEIYSHMFADEAAYPKLQDGLAVERIRLENNTISRVKTDGVRIGNGSGRNFTSSGRAATGGRVGQIALVNTTLTGITGQTMNILSQPTATKNVLITGSIDDGAAYSNPASGGAAPNVTGAEVTCN
ncbi:MAG: glycoside hydrolase family 55 protein [Burkholderiaceae bacterium]|nr:glycoside hydrolase family 55 protein [Burkholderiaceae bacterium]